MTALPAESSALEADFVMTSVTFKNSYSLGTSFTEVTLVELKASLQEFFFTAQKLVNFLEVFVSSIDLPHCLEKLVHFVCAFSL